MNKNIGFHSHIESLAFEIIIHKEKNEK